MYSGLVNTFDIVAKDNRHTHTRSRRRWHMGDFLRLRQIVGARVPLTFAKKKYNVTNHQHTMQPQSSPRNAPAVAGTKGQIS